MDPSIAAIPSGARADATIRGGVYGFRVRSDQPLWYLRASPVGTAPTLLVRVQDDGARPSGEPLRRWVPRPDNPFRAELFADGPSYRLRIDGLGWYRISPEDDEVWMPPEAEPLRREERLYGIPLALLSARHGFLPLHAASVQVGEAAVALAGPGRHGKTTLAAALMAAGHRPLSEDVTCCSLEPTPAVLPGPALLRVRADAFEHLELPPVRITLDDGDRIHLEIPEAERGDCAPVPLAAIVLLRPGDGPPEIRAASPQRVVQDLWALSTKLPTDEDRARCFTGLTELVDRVPTYDLRHPKRWEMLPRTIERLREVAAP